MSLRFLALCCCFVSMGSWADQEDPHLWLEDIGGEAALQWSKKHNDRSLRILTGDSRFKTLEKEALEILTSDARIPQGQILGEHVFNFWQDATHVRGVLRRTTLSSYQKDEPEWEVLLDMDELDDKEHENWVYQGYSCLSPDYERCYISMSRGGTDASVYREFSVGKKSFIEDGFVLPEAKSSVAWIDKDHWLVGSDWGEDSLTDSGYARVVKVWRRGQALADARTVLTGSQKDVGSFAIVFRDDKKAYPMVGQAVTFFESKYHLVDDKGETDTLPLPGRVSLQGVTKGRLLVTLNEDWQYQDKLFTQGSLVSLNLDSYAADVVYQPSEKESIEDVEVGKSAIFVELLDNVVGRVKKLTQKPDHWSIEVLNLPDNGVVSIQSASGKSDELLVSFESLTVPDSLYYVSDSGEAKAIKSLPEFYNADDVVVEQRFAKSKDGTSVPYFLMAQKEVLEKGDAPTIQYGYGGFLAAILPVYYSDPARPQHGALAGRMWVSRGGVLVLSNIRGGSEFGPAWHEAALKQNRQRAYDDFFAIAEHLISTGVTTPEKLGAIGRSNGGLLMGVALTQRPDLYAALDIGVPLADMKRYDKLLAGASWVGEYGDPDIKEEWDYIKQYSPYQNLKADADYPEVFFYTSTKDDRVHPGHARKMAARLNELGHSFLYYENFEGGHGGTANQDQLAFRTALEYMYFVQKLME